MKKILFGAMALMVGAGFIACNQKQDVQAGQAEGQTTEQVADSATENTPDLAALVAKAKAEGAKWSVDEWKAATKDMLIALKPMMLKINEAFEKLAAAPAATDMKEFEALEKEFAPMTKLMEEFETTAKASENGKKVMEDKAWEKSIKEELGIPEL